LLSVFAALLLLAAVVSTGAAASEPPTVRLTDGTTTAGGTTTVGVVLTSAPDGLAGYSLGLTVAPSDEGRIVDASYPATFGLTAAPEYSDGAATVTLAAADLTDAVDPGATGIRLATVTVGNADAGDLSVDPRQFDADDGSAIEPASVDDAGAGSGSGPTEGVDSGGPTDGVDDSDDSGGGDEDAGGSDVTPGAPANRATPTPTTPATETGPTPAATGSEGSAAETPTAVPSTSGDTGDVELSALSLGPIAVVGIAVLVVLAVVRLRRRA